MSQPLLQQECCETLNADRFTLKWRPCDCEIATATIDSLGSA